MTSIQRRIAVGSSYEVLVGRDLAALLPSILGDGVQRVAFIYPEPLEALTPPVIDVLSQRYDVVQLALPDGEDAKTLEVCGAVWEALGEAGFTRSDAVVTFGGGATTDVGGFIAAAWLRGVRVVHVPTTLLAMVDAAVGGKTGINTGAGKNLVGAFHEPTAVLCDLDHLRTLPTAELTAGLGEVAKCGFIADARILELIEQAPVGSLTADSPVLAELVVRAIQVKADVVSADLKETGGADGHPGREALNYGHTLAHAIEKRENYRIRHGEAVAIGCVYAAELAHRAGLLDAATVQRHRDVFGRAGLPTSYPGAGFDDLIGAMRVDKKTRGSVLRFLVLTEIGKPVILRGPAEEDLRAAYAAVSAR
jgi:3-dehydroquinate synthase